MKTIIILSLIVLSLGLRGQTIIDKTIPLRQSQTVSISFDYPELIKVSTWDKDEISIHASVEINNGVNDDAFELMIDDQGKSMVIENKIHDLKNLPQMITIQDGTEKILFKSKEEYKKYKSENGTSHDRVSWGVDMDITIEIKVPKGVETNVTSVYGMVEVMDFSGPLRVIAKYGGVDVALNEKTVGELSAETNYGQIYSNLDIRFKGDEVREKDFYTFVSAKPGSGPRYDFESKYGNVYLRKSN